MDQHFVSNICYHWDNHVTPVLRQNLSVTVIMSGYAAHGSVILNLAFLNQNKLSQSFDIKLSASNTNPKKLMAQMERNAYIHLRYVAAIWSELLTMEPLIVNEWNQAATAPNSQPSNQQVVGFY